MDRGKDKLRGLGKWGSKVMKNKWYLSRSFVRRKIVVRASVCGASLLLSSRSVFSHPFLYIHTIFMRLFRFTYQKFVTTASSTDASLTLSERRHSSWPYATTKPILKITFEFRVCMLCNERDERERERERSKKSGEKNNILQLRWFHVYGPLTAKNH